MVAPIRGEWPGVRTEEHPTDALLDLRKSLQLRLDETDQKVPFESMVDAGCDAARLFDLLVRIRRSVDWHAISRAEVTKADNALREAKKQLLRLKQSEIGRAVFEHLARADVLMEEIEWVRLGAERKLDVVSAKTKPRSDDARGNLISYVKQMTGEYHDDVVATLLSGALELPEEEWMSGEALRQWRSRHNLTSE